MANIIPPINAKGLWTLLDPFAGDISTELIYQCISIRRLSDIIGKGGDPLTDYYVPKGLEAQYPADRDAGVCIVTLQASSGKLIEVPTSYIQTYPNAAGILYYPTILGVDIGAISDGKDLAPLKELISNIVRDTVGIVTTITTVITGPAHQVDPESATNIEAARDAMITNSTTDRARRIAAENALASATQKIAQLEAYIRSLPPATP